MGNQSGNPSSVDFVQKDWQLTLSQSSQNQAKGNYRVLQNIISGQLIDEYQLVWNNEEDYRFYLDSYNWRKQQYNIVQSRYILVHNNEQFCSQSYAAKIYIEHIQTRLSDVTDIPHPDNLYVALATLEGYQKLYENVHHYFVIAEDQICVDKDGFVKVWVNSDLSKNYPETDLYANNDHKIKATWLNKFSASSGKIPTKSQSHNQCPSDNLSLKKRAERELDLIRPKLSVTSCQIPQKFVSILQMRDQSDEQNDTRYDQQEQQQYEAEQMEEHNQHYGQQNNSQFQNAQTYGQQPFYQHQGNFIGQNNGHISSPPTFYPMNSGSSSHFYHARHQNVPPVHQITQQFMPQVLRTINRPIITIPPPTIGRFVLSQGVQMMSNQVGLQKRLQTQAIYHNLRNFNPQMNNENWQFQNDDRQLGYDLSGFNQNQGFQQRISTLNPQSGQHYSEEQRYSNEPTFPQQTQNYGYQFVNNQNLGRQNPAVFGSPVNRSLQLIKKSQKVINQAQLMRIGKSHIDGSSNVQMLAKNFPATYQDLSYNNSRHTASGHDPHHHRRQGTHNDHEQYECVDTKYYTIDTQIQLDQQIAADLKKYILAA